MSMEDLKNEIDLLKGQLKAIIPTSGSCKEKDGWDKFSILSKFVASVLLVSIGGLYTYFYKERESQVQQNYSNQQLQIEEHKNRVLEMDAVAKLMPFISSGDEETRKFALLTLKNLASTKLVAALAISNPSLGAASALTNIAASEMSSEQDRVLAEKALGEILYRQNPGVAVARSETGKGALLTWVPPLTKKSGMPFKVLGYKIYYGTSSGNYANVIDVGDVTSISIDALSLDKGKSYYLAITAYDESGNESEFSREFTYKLEA